MLLISCLYDDVLQNSYRDFHRKGFNYICLRRSETSTLKLYSFADDLTNEVTDVVNPHDHRYDFSTTVLQGELQNILYSPDITGEKYYRFNYRTPLNNGNGFEFAGETKLEILSKKRFGIGMTCRMLAEQIHTIKVKPGTLLLLKQEADKNVEFSTTYSKDPTAPELSGLYSKFTFTQLKDHLQRICEKANIDIQFFNHGFLLESSSV